MPPLKRAKIGFQDQLSFNAGQKYCRMDSSILLTFINVPFAIKIFVLSIFEWLLKTGFTVLSFFLLSRFTLQIDKSKCHLSLCQIYFYFTREVEGRESSNSGMSGLINESLQHLTASHMTYFTHWCLMLDLESQKDQEKRTVADIWCKSSTDRFK